MSSRYSETFTIACKYVEELLRHIYEEYRLYCRKKGYKEVELHVKKLEVSQPNSLQGSFYSDLFPLAADNSLTYNSSFLTSSNAGSFMRYNDFMPNFMNNNDRWNRAAAELDGFNSKNNTLGDDTLMRNDNLRGNFGKSQSFTVGWLNETEEERAKRKEKSKNAWLEKYGAKKNNQEP